MGTKVFQFGPFVLDPEVGILSRGGAEVALRPKTFALLQFLVTNPGRLIAKKELLSEVWPGVIVTDDALVQVVGELRRALGDDGPQLIRTVSRRGYRFEGTVSIATRAAPGNPISSWTGYTGDAPTPPTGMDVEPHEDLRPPSPSAVLFAPRSPSGHGAIADQDASTTAKGQGHLASRRWLSGLAALAVLVFASSWSAIEWRTPRRVAGHPEIPATWQAVEAGPSVAVLPFLVDTDDGRRLGFADAATQELIGALGRFSTLSVVSWNAVAPYRVQQEGPVEGARRLGARYQVEGRLEISQDRVHLTAHLVETGGRVLWVGRYEDALPERGALPDALVERIAGALSARTIQAEQRRLAGETPGTLRAYELALKARPALQHPSRAGIVDARALLRQAVLIDPNHAGAYAALAETYHIDLSWGWAESPATSAQRAEEYATRAIILDDANVQARVVLGRSHLLHERFEAARTEIDKALEINPSDSGALAARGNILVWLGETEAAIVALEHALRINPQLSAIDRFSLSLAYFLHGRLHEAVSEATFTLRQSDSSHFSLVILAAAHAQLGQNDEAAHAVSLLRRRDPTFDPGLFGNKFRRASDLEQLRNGMRRAGLYDG